MNNNLTYTRCGVTEALKAGDPMKWTGLMNSLKTQAEEIVLAELTYN
ncbi:MAG: TnpV protein [Ruminococcaceae bacterium]|nr:TnpV protein [Oscillospiraceae bacterium]